MSYPELDDLTRAEQLFDDGKLDQALEFFNNQSYFKKLNIKQKQYFQFLKGLVLLYQSKHSEAILLGKLIINEDQESNEITYSIDGFSLIFLGLILDEEYDEAYEVIKNAEDSLKPQAFQSQKEFIQRRIRILISKAWIYLNKGNIDLAEDCLGIAFKIEKKVDNTFEIVWANLLNAQIALRVKDNFDLALKYIQKAKSIAERIKFGHFWVGMCYFYLGVIFYHHGEFENSLGNYEKSLNIFKRLKSKFWLANILNDKGNIFGEKGEYENAMEIFEKSLVLYEIPSLGKANCLNSIIYYALENNDLDRAQNYFDQLEEIYDQKKDNHIEIIYRFTKALMLKKSIRIRDKAKAEKLLKKVIKTETLLFAHFSIYAVDLYIIYAYIHLCDLFLAELFITNNDSEVREELNHYISKLLNVAEKSHSYLIFCETFLLQAKLALVSLELKNAQIFLTQAQKIAESHKMKRLAILISTEHDKFLRELNIWEELKKSGAPLSERWKLAGLNEQIENLVKKRITVVPEITNEEPVLLLIVSEGGVPFFSYTFGEEKSFESHLFGGFLSTIDYFIREMFSVGLDRAVFGDYSLLMKAIPPFFISYIFKGDSYYALQKLDHFKVQLQKKSEIWQNLLRNFQKNTTIQLNDEPLLESLITETFISKNLLISE